VISTLEKLVMKFCVISMLTGACLNYIVLFVNDGKMPVDTTEPVISERHIPMNESSRLTMLADIFHAELPYGVKATYSIGDVFIYSGVLTALILLTGYFFLMLKYFSRRLIF